MSYTLTQRGSSGEVVHKNITASDGSRLNCQFYSRIGACRHGEKCSRNHVKPTSSNVIILPNLYQNPKLNKNDTHVDDGQIQKTFDHFYEDVFIKFASLGQVVELAVCENENNHLNGNVYVTYHSKEEAARAAAILNQEWYNGKPVYCDLSPVDKIDDATCRAYEESNCARGDICNFMHLRHPTHQLEESLHNSQKKSIILRKLAKVSSKPVTGSGSSTSAATATATATATTATATATATATTATASASTFGAPTTFGAPAAPVAPVAPPTGREKSTIEDISSLFA
ncbi:uncharacterized protein RJT21DRAFT_133393 [Scheffersomyces amazonensis]|uniref:uncharacterized protein n=1 Tax=Scheffersomyces amazonensis TaxID=1078765 RepID=UPI00315C69FB